MNAVILNRFRVVGMIYFTESCFLWRFTPCREKLPFLGLGCAIPSILHPRAGGRCSILQGAPSLWHPHPNLVNAADFSYHMWSRCSLWLPPSRQLSPSARQNTTALLSHTAQTHYSSFGLLVPPIHFIIFSQVLFACAASSSGSIESPVALRGQRKRNLDNCESAQRSRVRLDSWGSAQHAGSGPIFLRVWGHLDLEGFSLGLLFISDFEMAECNTAALCKLKSSLTT